MANAIIGFPRHTDVFTPVGGAWQAARPLSRITALPLSRAARSADLQDSSLIIQGTSASPRPIGLVGICNHNLSIYAWRRLKLYADTALTELLYDSDWGYVWPRVKKSSTTSWWAAFRWFGRPSATEREGLVANAPIILPQTYFIKGYELSLHDPLNASGYVSIGLLELAEKWQLAVNFRYGAAFGMRFRDRLSDAEQGGVYVEERHKARVFRGEVPVLGIDDVKLKAFEHQRQLGVKHPFLWIPNPEDEVNWARDVCLMRNANPGLFSHTFANRGGVPLDFEEVLG